MKLQTFLPKQRKLNFFFSLSPLVVFHIQEKSMLQVLLPGDAILVNKLAYLFMVPKIGDVIIIQNPQKDEKRNYLVKRVVKIKENKIFVEGDNKKESIDSRHFGWIDKKTIVGKMIRKV